MNNDFLKQMLDMLGETSKNGGSGLYDNYDMSYLTDIVSNNWQLNTYEKERKKEQERPTPMLYKINYVAVVIYDDGLIIDRGVEEYMLVPRDELSDTSYKKYSASKISENVVEEMIEVLYQQYLKKIDKMKEELEQKIKSKNKIFKQQIRIKKITNIIDDID